MLLFGKIEYITYLKLSSKLIIEQNTKWSPSLSPNIHHSTFGEGSNHLQLWFLYSIPEAASNTELQYHESNESWNAL